MSLEAEIAAIIDRIGSGDYLQSHGELAAEQIMALLESRRIPVKELACYATIGLCVQCGKPSYCPEHHPSSADHHPFTDPRRFAVIPL